MSKRMALDWIHCRAYMGGAWINRSIALTKDWLRELIGNGVEYD